MKEVFKLTKQKKYIIYVDASGIKENTEFKISLYDIQTNATEVLALDTNIQDSNAAEIYAIIYAIMYINKHNISNAMILCDNQSAVKNKAVSDMAKLFNISLLWIPREINIVADKISKLEPTKKAKEFYLLEMFVKTINYVNIDNKCNQELKNLKEQIKIKNEKIKNQATQLTSLKKKN